MVLTDADRAKLALLAPSFRRRLERLLNDAPTRIAIRSGYRSRAEQQALYDAWRAGRGNPANRPGTSRHETGEAADLRWLGAGSQAWAHENASSYGLHFPYSHEPWHVESDGTPDPPESEDLDMTPDELRKIVRAEVDAAVALVIRGSKTHPDNLARIRAELRDLAAKVDKLA